MPDDFSELDRQRRAAEGLRRTRRMMVPGTSRRDAPLPSSERGHRLELVVEDDLVRFRLDGTWVLVGDVLELYTNTANGWVRGRFEWSGEREERPRLALNLWDPTGPRDEEGLPPYVGALEAPLPEGAVLRWAN